MAAVNTDSTSLRLNSRLGNVYQFMNVFWTIVLYLSFLLGVYTFYANNPERMRTWSGVVLVVAGITFFVVYHTLYLRVDNWWPMPPRRARIYFPVMTALFGILVFLSPAFSGLGYALIAHVCCLLHWKRWALPLIPVMALIAWSYGVFAGDLIALVIFGFSMAIVLGVFFAIAVLTHQRWQLAELVRDLGQAKAELERNAAQTEELAALRERTRLARDMHDSIGHALVVVNVKLEAAQRLYRKDTLRGDAELEETRGLVRETMADLRRSLADLRAPLGDSIDLLRALGQIAVEVEKRSPLAIEVHVDPQLPTLPPALAEAVWRIAREAITNVERHAAAASATISLDCHSGTLLLRVADDGSGVRAVDLARPDHFGVIGMRERVEALGGAFQIAPRSGGGTVVEATFPLHIIESEPMVYALDSCSDR